jgi:hypothetical protein
MRCARAADRGDGGQLSLFDAALPAASPAPSRAPAAAPPATVAAAPDPATAAPVAFRHPQAQREIRLDGHAVGYLLRRASRRSIGLMVGVDGLVVTAPRWVGQGDIDAALRAKARWVLRKLHDHAERQRRQADTPAAWRDGGTVPYLGQPLQLVLDGGACGPGGVALDEAAGVLRVALPADAAPSQVRDGVQAWLQRQARRHFEARCGHYAERLGVRMTRLALSAAATRWGSASADGSIRLNWRLIHLPPASIDYVVAHELAHLREMNHSAAFWSVVESVIPDWRTRRRDLRDPAVALPEPPEPPARRRRSTR